MNYLYRYIALLVCVTSTLSCKRYLDAKPDASLSVLETLNDLQAFLDDNSIMNTRYPYLSEIGSDNFYLTDQDYISITNIMERDLYLWNKTETNIETFIWCYPQILQSNIALHELENIKYSHNEQNKHNNVKGSALFFRGFYFYTIAQLFGQPYHSTTAAKDLGIPIRLSPEYQETSERKNVYETYNQIIRDLRAAAILLPSKPLGGIKTRPSKAAAYGTLAKTFLAMQEYDSAGYYADKSLQIHDSLLNYNSPEIDAELNAPIPRFNKEIVFYARGPQGQSSRPSRAKVDSFLFRSYNELDLRKKVFFKANTGVNKGTYNFKGDYDQQGTTSGYVFGGVVTDEMYLIRAESLARNGNIVDAMKDLDKLLENRWVTGAYIPKNVTTADEAIDIILEERRKELIMRGTRWTDIRRLQYEPNRAITIKRKIDGKEYFLSPNSPRHTLQIPSQVIQLTGMPQNP